MIARFKSWFFDYFWYHYKIHAIVALVLLIAAIFFIHERVTAKEPDFSFALVSEYTVQESHGDIIKDYFFSEFGYNTKRTVIPTLQTGEASIALLLASDQYTLYIIGEGMTGYFSGMINEETFIYRDMAELGFPTVDGSPWLTPLHNLPEEWLLPPEPHYALLRKADKPSHEWRVENAIGCLARLLDRG